MRVGTARRRGARAALALLVGLLVGGWLGGGLIWVFNRSKLRDPETVGSVMLEQADELKMVPADSLGFVHVRLAELWKTPAMAEFRKVVEKAGPDMLKALDEGFVPAPSTVDRVTVVVLKGEPAPAPKKGQPVRDEEPEEAFGLGGKNGPNVLAIVSFTAPLDAAKFRQANLPTAVSKRVGDKEYWQDNPAKIAVHFPSDRLLVLGLGPAMEAFLGKPTKTEGPLASAIQLAASGSRHLVAAVDATAIPIPTELGRMIPLEVIPLVRAESMTAGLVVGSGVKVDLRATYRDEDAASKAEEAVKKAAEKGRDALKEMKTKMEDEVKGKGKPTPRPVEEMPQAIGGLIALGAINMLDEWLASPPLTREGKELSASVTLPSFVGASMQMNAVAIGLLLPAVQKVREAASNAKDQNNLRQLALAMHVYHDAYGTLPAPAVGKKPDGGPAANLSWRVALLPFIEQAALYNQFKLDEPWDSPANKKLIPMMPRTYASPRSPATPGMTYYKVFVGSADQEVKPIFFPFSKTVLPKISDGTANTILIAEGGEPVIWTKPDDIPFDPKKALPKLTLPGTSVINVAMADGSVKRINLDTVSEKTLRALITANGGEVLPPGVP